MIVFDEGVFGLEREEGDPGVSDVSADELIAAGWEAEFVEQLRPYLGRAEVLRPRDQGRARLNAGRLRRN